MQDTIINTLAAPAAKAADSLARGAAAGWDYNGIESIIRGDGIMISIVGIIIVFSALTVITLLIRALKLINEPKKAAEKSDSAVAGTPARNGVSGEVVAAIALALQTHLFELHDEERTIITIKRVSRPYSPWNSKLYGMTPSPYKPIIKR